MDAVVLLMVSLHRRRKRTLDTNTDEVLPPYRLAFFPLTWQISPVERHSDLIRQPERTPLPTPPPDGQSPSFADRPHGSCLSFAVAESVIKRRAVSTSVSDCHPTASLRYSVLPPISLTRAPACTT